MDPNSGQVVRLFHPRNDGWTEHFQREGALVQGKTAIGRVTVQVLGMNTPDQVVVREQLLQEGWDEEAK